ncbi:DISARM system helicase DrmA [Alicyclobacillus hesperidum]|uniref:DISARM system helicase DrmA n=1 Tax=Alicyclobacillus hesperidum TaxID=89784 RepID=UPI000307B2F6|nr:DISARM system helicase DrmA [Alicyclobacillus hesperidum]
MGKEFGGQYREFASTGQLANAWIVYIDKKASFNGYSITLALQPDACKGVHDGDIFLLVREYFGQLNAVAFARVYCKRSTAVGITFLFDGVVSVEPQRNLSELGIPSRSSRASITRLDWELFERGLETVCGINFSSFPILSGDTPSEQAYIRELLQYAVMDDLLGPAGGPTEEIIGMSVRDRYLVGKLAPRNTRIEDEDDIAKASGQIEVDESEGEIDASTNQSLVPSSIGFTFCVDGSVTEVELEANWGRYERGESEQINEKNGKPFRSWRRIPSGGTKTIVLKQGTIEPFAIDVDCPDVLIQGSVSSQIENGDRLVTLFLVNTQETPEQNQDAAWVFQPEMIVRDKQGRAIFRRRHVLTANGSDPERESLEMIYRNHVEFAVGHGVSVHAITADDDTEHAVEIRTSVIPCYEIPVTETPGLDVEDRPAMRRLVNEGYLDMEQLANLEIDQLINALTILTDDYREWIAEQRARIGTAVRGYDESAKEAMDRCEIVLCRLRDGIEVLASNDKALEAFRFANRAMASQRIHSIYALQKRRGENPDLEALNVPKNRSWRPFQLAFMLLSIPSLADPTHQDRTESLEAYADLLWFPTGGGKTEAYLGVAAFTMAIRRFQDNLGGLDSGRGLAVIMRYTLRLLTLQQFQRATALICAMEVLRRGNPEIWGEEPFTIGLWVGQRVTPNTTKESHDAIEAEREKKHGSGSTPAQLTSCPWCGSEILPGRDIRVDRDTGRTLIYCGDKYGRCDFSPSKSKNLGIPVLVVDDEIYRRPPSMLIATVDKFALMAWRGQVRTLFGRVSQECPRHGLLWPEADCTGNHQKKGTLPSTSVRQIRPIRPPDLIIQDEFHLISGPLGTMVGLYETAVDELCSWTLNGKTIRPKIIASTATVRKAEDQVHNVFLRKVAVFPPHGLDVEDNFFSVQRPVEKKPGRRYIGVCSPGSSRPAVLIRVYVALLTAAQALFDHFGQGADPYMTVVGYFNSLRELGGMRRLAEDDVQTRCYRVQMSNVARPGLHQRSIRTVDELTSRVSNKDIPKKLDQLEVKFKDSWEKGETRAIDIVLATNMLSVGVDVNRLGLMVVNGQPKSTAEYIQATSRVGRSFPGLVCAVLTWSRPRDLSHYETFEHYHATFYKHVEAQSVTPFAPRALDRGLTGTMVSCLRMYDDTLNPNEGAQLLNSTTKPEVEKVKHAISERAWKVKGKAAKEDAVTMISARIDRWVKEALKPGRRLGYEMHHGQGDMAALLKKPGVLAWDEFTVPMSMREVEPGVQLVMDVRILQDPPKWRIRDRDTTRKREIQQ